ncbi:hypothetical protein J6590_028626, partial [Homalodisca vitripennis]
AVYKRARSGVIDKTFNSIKIVEPYWSTETKPKLMLPRYFSSFAACRPLNTVQYAFISSQHRIRPPYSVVMLSVTIILYIRSVHQKTPMRSDRHGIDNPNAIFSTLYFGMMLIRTRVYPTYWPGT